MSPQPDARIAELSARLAASFQEQIVIIGEIRAITGTMLPTQVHALRLGTPMMQQAHQLASLGMDLGG
jgi:hypothetical protein